VGLSQLKAFLRASLAVGLVVGVSACGGGGGGGSPSPVLGTLSFTTNENIALTASLTATDPGGVAVTFSQMGNPTSGKVSGFTPAGMFTYTPNPNFTGSDSFGIQATDTAGNMTAGTVKVTVTVNQPPAASSTILRADGAALAKINVLQTASDPDKDPLTVTILDQPPSGAGTASVNSDGTVSLSALPSGFKGLTHFKYQVADPSGATAKAAAAVFVGTDPFRAAFVGDAPGNGSNEVYLTDFAADPVVMTAATQGNLRLKGFAASDNGATIVYRTEDTTPAKTSLSFVKTATPTQSTSIPLPTGTVPVLDANNRDQFLVSPDGQWIAVIAGQGNSDSLYVVNIAAPTVVSQIQPSGAVYATLPAFSLDSKSIYFLATGYVPATGVAPGAHKSLYYASLSSPGQTTLMSMLSDPATTSDDVSAFSVSPDQTRILLQAIRGGKSGVFFVDAQHPTVENQLNEPVVGQSVGGTTIGLPAGRGGSTTVSRVVYEVQGVSLTHPPGIYVAEVSGTPNPRLAIQNSSAQVVGLRPDDAAFLYTDGAQVSEAVVDTPGSQSVGGGYGGWYDSTGNIVLLPQHLPYQALASTSRGAFGTTNQVGTTSLAVDYTDVSGFDRGVAIIGQGPTSGTPPTTSTLQIVSALAPRGLLSLASFQSPLQLTSDSSKVVSK
jgi:hypothetical protein